jgi:hypothetical protein
MQGAIKEELQGLFSVLTADEKRKRQKRLTASTAGAV